MVNATSEYFAAIAYNAERSCMREDHLPPLTSSTILRVRAVGQRRIRRVLWQDVVDQANREAELAFGKSMPPGERLAHLHIEPDLAVESLPPHNSDGARCAAWETQVWEMPSEAV